MSFAIKLCMTAQNLN